MAAWVGVVATASLAFWLALVGWHALAGQHQVGLAVRRMADNMVGPVMLGVVLVVVVCEQLWPAVPQPLLCRAHIVDGCYLLLAAVVVAPTLPLVQSGLGVELGRHASFLVLGRLHTLPQLVVSGLILLGIDAMNWCAHVANHRLLAFWRLHALHHSQEDMSVLTTFRTHPLLHATYALSLLPVLMLSASGTVPATALIVYGCLVTVPHANLRWSYGPLGRVIVSPAYHRLHHAREDSGRGAVNFGFVLVAWDRLAGRAAYPDTSSAPIATGLSGRPVPVEQDGAHPVARIVADQLLQPFRLVSATDTAT